MKKFALLGFLLLSLSCVSVQASSKISSLSAVNGLAIGTIPTGWYVMRNPDVDAELVYWIIASTKRDEPIATIGVFCFPFDERESVKDRIVKKIVREHKENFPDDTIDGPNTRSREEGGGFAVDFHPKEMSISRYYYRIRRVEEEHVMVIAAMFVGDGGEQASLTINQIDALAAVTKFVAFKK
jgi:hypothetical protein